MAMAMSPLYSWLAVFAVTAAAAWYYSGRPNLVAKIMPQANKTIEEPLIDSSRKKKSRSKRNFAGEQVDSLEAMSTPMLPMEDASKRRKIAPPAPTKRSVNGAKQEEESRRSLAQGDDSSLSNEEFAKQFTRARSGTPITSTLGKPSLSKMDRRVSKDNLVAKRKADSNFGTSSTLTDGSSTTGADGDDDLSPIGSPPLGATYDKATKAGDVSDMLEAPSPGPAVLRLTDPKGTINKLQPKPAAKPFEAAETKKQRQARQKREAAKEANEMAERERRKLMEKQIRGARMAEGTSAQSKATAFKSAPENAWFANNRGRDQNAVQRPSESYVEELDVRDQDVQPVMQRNGAGAIKPLSNVTSQPAKDGSADNMKKTLSFSQTDALGTSARANGRSTTHEIDGAPNAHVAEPASSEQSKAPSWADDMISEEEQMRMALEEQDSWQTVSSKKDRRKGGKANESNDVSTTSEASTEHSRANGSGQRPFANGTLKTSEGLNRYVIVAQDENTWEP